MNELFTSGSVGGPAGNRWSYPETGGQGDKEKKRQGDKGMRQVKSEIQGLGDEPMK